VEEILTAVSEACLNALEHGNRLRRERKVTVEMKLTGHACTFRIYDEGTGFDEERIYARRDVKPGDDDSRGWGFLFISSFTDQIRLGNENGKFFVELMFLLEPAKGGIHNGNGTTAPC
jgi:anti-sigma regulatory factor (Ser/Thr protein kinase)